MKTFRRTFLVGMVLSLALVLVSGTAHAGDYTLSNNSGSESTVWFISGEKSLVINGFDLQARGVNRPVELDRVSIDVVTPVPNQSVDVVVYEDADGGSPSNATLAGRQSVTINQSGRFTTTFNPPVEITQPVVWVGFYLPVDFEFRADTSGTSVLTYWGWTPGTTFDISNPSNAEVFGPADGSAPVNIDMGGVARITAELITDGQVVNDDTTGVAAGPSVTGDNLDEPARDSQGRIIQAVGDPNTDLTAVRQYRNDECSALRYDTEDIRVNYNGNVTMNCKKVSRLLEPEWPEGYRSDVPVFDVWAYGIVSPGTREMPYPITHCLLVEPEDLNSAVMGLAWGSPQEWEILPTVRYGDYICADLDHTGFVSYFVPTNN